jgi:hypothetical protein
LGGHKERHQGCHAEEIIVDTNEGIQVNQAKWMSES